MQKTCEDSYSTTFCSFEDMQKYHEDLTLGSQWLRYKINELHIEPLDRTSSLYGTPSSFAPRAQRRSGRGHGSKFGPRYADRH